MGRKQVKKLPKAKRVTAGFDQSRLEGPAEEVWKDKISGTAFFRALLEYFNTLPKSERNAIVDSAKSMGNFVRTQEFKSPKVTAAAASLAKALNASKDKQTDLAATRASLKKALDLKGITMSLQQ